MKIGIDISSHQGNIDLETIKAENQLDFVIIRVGYGVKGAIDTKFERNADLCKQLNIPVGFYWYSYALTREDANKEAHAFLNAIEPYRDIISMGCWFDMEDADGYKKRNGMPTDQTLQDMCEEFCQLVENAGYFAGVYASKSWFENQLKPLTLNKWLAYWPTTINGKQKGMSVEFDSRPNDSDLSFTLWQFTSKGKFNGYKGDLDTNYAYGESLSSDNSPSDSTDLTDPIDLTGSVLDLAVNVMKGIFGDDEARKNALGSRYEEVQNFINHIYSATTDTLANEIIRENKYGTGDIRKTVLGSRYEEVQHRVNQLINYNSITKGAKVRFTGTKSYSGIKLADWTHGDIFNVIEVSGDRVVIGKGSVVTAAVNIKYCELIKK